jgi:hypothetical protein
LLARAVDFTGLAVIIFFSRLQALGIAVVLLSCAAVNAVQQRRITHSYIGT